MFEDSHFVVIASLSSDAWRSLDVGFRLVFYCNLCDPYHVDALIPCFVQKNIIMLSFIYPCSKDLQAGHYNIHNLFIVFLSVKNLSSF